MKLQFVVVYTSLTASKLIEVAPLKQKNVSVNTVCLHLVTNLLMEKNKLDLSWNRFEKMASPSRKQVGKKSEIYFTSHTGQT